MNKIQGGDNHLTYRFFYDLYDSNIHLYICHANEKYEVLEDHD